MWWYREQRKNASGGGLVPPPDAAAPVDPQTAVESALREALSGRPDEPDALLAMCLLVDHTIRFADGGELAPMSWQRAERTVARARTGPTRLYNAFAKDFGDGYSLRPDLPPEHREILTALHAALLASAAVTALESVV